MRLTADSGRNSSPLTARRERRPRVQSVIHRGGERPNSTFSSPGCVEFMGDRLGAVHAQHIKKRSKGYYGSYGPVRGRGGLCVSPLEMRAIVSGLLLLFFQSDNLLPRCCLFLHSLFGCAELAVEFLFVFRSCWSVL